MCLGGTEYNSVGCLGMPELTECTCKGEVEVESENFTHQGQEGITGTGVVPVVPGPIVPLDPRPVLFLHLCRERLAVPSDVASADVD